jgi:hypothetical protein
MNCQGLGLFNKFLSNEISQYLNYKKAKTVAEKQMHSGIFIQSNERRFEKEFCVQKCVFRKTCSLKEVVNISAAGLP